MFPQGSTCLVVLWILLPVIRFHVRGFHPLWLAFPKPFCYPLTMTYAVRTPDCTQSGLGSFPFARRYLGNHCCFLFLRLLRCFSSPGSLYMAMYSPYSDRSFSCRVSPFRNLRVNGYLLLTVAYRSLSRPSSAPDAKAFPLRSFQLDLSNHLLILKVELCRQFNRIFEIVIVTHLYDVPQLKLKIRSSVLSNKRPLCCLAYHFYITLFSFQGSIFQLLLQPDLKICLYARSSNPTTNVTGMVGPSGLEPPTLRLSVVRSSQLSYGPL